MSDYYSGVRLQLELDELLDRYTRLQARLKDIDTGGLQKGWQDLMREIQRRSRRLHLKWTNDGRSMVLELLDQDQERVKMSDINRALDELYKKSDRNIINVVEIEQEIDYDDNDESDPPRAINNEQTSQQQNVFEEHPDDSSSSSSSSTEEINLGDVIMDALNMDLESQDVIDEQDIQDGDDGSMKAVETTEDNPVEPYKSTQNDDSGSTVSEGDTDVEEIPRHLESDSEEELDHDEGELRVDSSSSSTVEINLVDVIMDALNMDSESQDVIDEQDIQGGDDGSVKAVETTEDNPVESYKSTQNDDSGSTASEGDTDVEEIPRHLESDSEEELDHNEGELRVVHVVYDPETKSFIEKDSSDGEEYYEEEETLRDGQSDEMVEAAPEDVTTVGEEEEVTEVCQITWKDMCREVGPALTNQCKAYCRQLQTVIKTIDDNIEALTELIRILTKFDRIVEENFQVYMDESNREANAKSKAMYRSLIEQMAGAKEAISQLVRALPQLEADREVGWPYEEARPFPNAWAEE